MNPVVTFAFYLRISPELPIRSLGDEVSATGPVISRRAPPAPSPAPPGTALPLSRAPLTHTLSGSEQAAGSARSAQLPPAPCSTPHLPTTSNEPVINLNEQPSKKRTYQQAIDAMTGAGEGSLRVLPKQEGSTHPTPKDKRSWQQEALLAVAAVM